MSLLFYGLYGLYMFCNSLYDGLYTVCDGLYKARMTVVYGAKTYTNHTNRRIVNSFNLFKPSFRTVCMGCICRPNGL